MTRTFRYFRPSSIQEACELKAKHGQKARFWAGGTDLLLEWRRGAVDFEVCIDLSGLDDLRTIRRDDQGTTIGALTTIAALEAHQAFDNGLAVLRTVARQFATPQIRNLATLGGNLCHAVPSADLAPPLMALDARVRLIGLGGERTLSMEEFFTDVRQTALRKDELLIEIVIPHPPPHSTCSFQKVTRTAVDIALVNAAARLTIDAQGRCTQARVALGAVAPVAFRSVAAEGLLVGRPIEELTDEQLTQAGERAAADTRPISDVRTTAAYRRYVTKIVVRRSLMEALRQLKGRV